jgi:hypothetical protein
VLILHGVFAKGDTPDHPVLGQGIGRTELPSHVAIGSFKTLPDSPAARSKRKWSSLNRKRSLSLALRHKCPGKKPGHFLCGSVMMIYFAAFF